MPTNGLVVMTPTSIASTGTGNSSSINADGSVDFASCATLSLNGVFTSSYDNYMVTIRHVGSVNDVSIFYRLRASGTDNTTASSYTRQVFLASDTTIVGVRVADSGAGFSIIDDSERGAATGYFFGPYLAQPTAVRSTTMSGFTGAALADIASTHNQSTSYDGVTFYPNSGTMTGLLTVFGFDQ